MFLDFQSFLLYKLFQISFHLEFYNLTFPMLLLLQPFSTSFYPTNTCNVKVIFDNF